DLRWAGWSNTPTTFALTLALGCWCPPAPVWLPLSCSLHLLAASPSSYDSWLCFVAAFHGCLLAPGCCFWLH
ncbi:hypothetical protein V8C86DRAFT_2908238, partial [Haematococcus lacustris]